MQWLMDVTNEMHREFERVSLSTNRAISSDAAF
jgi:hypothetical protein